jgi:hypothetical protein
MRDWKTVPVFEIELHHDGSIENIHHIKIYENGKIEGLETFWNERVSVKNRLPFLERGIYNSKALLSPKTNFIS